MNFVLRQVFTFFCRPVSIALAVAAAGCRVGTDPGDGSRFEFAVVNVGQGLSQIGVRGSAAAVWDLGLPDAYPAWEASWRMLGRPQIRAIVISHGDLDHCGGLAHLSESVDFTGQLVVSAFEDTAALRAQSGEWSSRIFFRSIAQGESLGVLDGVDVRCVWPPADVDLTGTEDQVRNRRSLCFRVSWGTTSAFISSDIDTVAANRLSSDYGYALVSDILVVPHHGSRGSVDPVFFGFVRPVVAIISCAAPPNPYGHPSAEVIDLLLQMGTTVARTYTSGTIVGRSNGEYWEWDSALPASRP